MTSPALTLYIPVYNGAGHLARCFASLVALPAERVEVVVVDDASTDGSLGLAQDLAQSRPGTQVVARPRNGGTGVASRDAMAVARGRWIQRVDADDEVVAAGILSALDIADEQGVEVVVQPYLQETKDGRMMRKSRAPWSGEEKTDAYWVGWLPTVWSSMVSTAFLARHRLLYPTLGVGCDSRWLAAVYARVPLSKVRFSDSVSYIWRHNRDSLTRRSRGRAESDAWLAGLRLGLLEHDEVYAGLVRDGLATRRDQAIASLYLRQFILADELAAGRKRDAWRTWLEMVRAAPSRPRAWAPIRRLLFPAWMRRPSLLFKGGKGPQGPLSISESEDTGGTSEETAGR